MVAAGAVPVFLNEAAGLRYVDAPTLQRQLGPAVTIHSVRIDALPDRIRAELAAGTHVIGVAGGDGTMRTAAGVLAGTAATLLCVPTGTLNNFSRRIGIGSVRAAADALASGSTRMVVIGMIDDDVFLNTVTIGEYSRVVRMRERFRRHIGKWPAAGVAFAAVLLSLRRITITLRTGDAELTHRTSFLWVGIGWRSFPRVPHARERRSNPDLEVAVLRSGGLRASAAFMFRVALHIVRGTDASDDAELEVLHTRSLTIDASHRIDSTADGEPRRLEPPIRISLHEAGLRVLVGSGMADGPA